MTYPTHTTYTVHYVLAAAYRGGRIPLAHTLAHASVDLGDTPMCGRVSAESLADVFGTPRGLDATCPECVRRVRRLGLVRLDPYEDT